MSQLTYLLDEICTGIEIYYSGRTGGQYLKTSFILCDDYSELISKLFLLKDNPNWSDSHDKEAKKYEEAKKAICDAYKVGKNPEKTDIKKLEKGAGKDRFKNYHDILKEVQTIFLKKRTDGLPRVELLHKEMSSRREKRNGFFHSANLLDLNVNQRSCVESFCDLLEYGELLFSDEWKNEIEICRELRTFEVLLKLEKLSFSDTTVMPKINNVLKDWPRREKDRDVKRRGAQYSEYPEDLHLRLCVIWGGRDLRSKLGAILNLYDHGTP